MEAVDRALVERARKGDHDAFAALATASRGRLYATATLMLRDPDAAKDAVQEALIAAWRGIRALRDPDAWDAWVHRLCVHACYRVGRRMHRAHLVELDVTQHEQAVDDTTEGFAGRDELDRAFGRLTLELRAVLILHFVHDLRIEDAAQVLGIPPGTVKSRIHRAKDELRAALEADARGIGALPGTVR